MNNHDEHMLRVLCEDLKKQYSAEEVYEIIVKIKESLTNTLNDDQKQLLDSIFKLFDLYSEISSDDAFYRGVFETLNNDGDEDYENFVNKTGPYEYLRKE